MNAPVLSDTNLNNIDRKGVTMAPVPCNQMSAFGSIEPKFVDRSEEVGVSSCPGSNFDGPESRSEKANALREQGVGVNKSNIKYGQYSGHAFPNQDNASAIIVGPVPAVVEHLAIALPTVSPTRLLETDETDETDYSEISNADFLSAIFGIIEVETRPIVCNFSGNPGRRGANWSGRPWMDGTTDTVAANQNWYFSLAAFVRNSEGKYRRTRAQFAALSAIMLDDVGTKACARARLDDLPPSWLIETSPGNYQAGYLFAEPLADGGLAEAIVKAVIKAGMCDPGASGPLARYARLPVGINGKHTPEFQCRLVEWHPERRYTPEQIVAGLELTLPATMGSHPAAPVRSAAWAEGEDDVYTPRPSENPVITALKERSLYKSPLGSGKHDVTCPWVHEHTGGVDGGAAYFEPDGRYPIGGFKCLHGHCAERHIHTLIEHLGVLSGAAKHKPVIRAIPGALNRVVGAAELELSRSGHHYQRAGLIVTVVTDPSTHETTIKALNQSNILNVLCDRVIWERFDARLQGYVVTDPPMRYISVLYDHEHYRHMHVLNGLARQPYLRPDASLMTCAGYDAPTGMFGTFDESKFSVAENPAREDAMQALAVIGELLNEFGFEEEIDKSATIAAILTAAIRPSLAQAPMFHVKAPQIASGKSYLTNLIGAFASPISPSATAFPQNEEECLKLLLSALLSSPAVLCFDNLTTDLAPYKSLCSALTEPSITGRILGVSKTAAVGTRTLFLSSGNNVDPVRDMARRCVTIRLDPACEIPTARTFKSDPVTKVRSDRGRYVSMALTIIRAWVVAERPLTPCKPLGSYGAWSDLVRQPLLWLGLPDPATSVFNSMAADPDRESLGRFLRVWDREFGNSPTMVREVVAKAHRLSATPHLADLYEVIADIADQHGEINRRRLGWWISRHAGRLVDGLKFQKVPSARNADQWKVVSASSVPSVPSVSSVASGTTTESLEEALLTACLID